MLLLGIWKFSAFYSGYEFILLSFYMGYQMRIHLLSSNLSLILVPFAWKNPLFCGYLQDLFDSPSYPIGFYSSASYFLSYSSLITRFLSIFKFILRKFHRYIQCIPIIFTQHSLPPTPGLLPMHLLLASWLFFSLFLNNPLSPICAAHMHMGVGSSTGSWAPCQWPHPKENHSFCPEVMSCQLLFGQD